jgi:cytochrome c-type biogenesis protein
MGDGMTERIAEAMTHGSPWLLPLAFVGGLCTSLNPCAYPMMGAVAGYVWNYGKRSTWRSLAVSGTFLLGLALTYALLGAAGSLVGPLLGLSRHQWLWAVGVICVVAGVFMAEVLPLEFPGVSLVARFWTRLRGLPGALLLGVLLGLVATPCATPPLVAVVSIASAQNAVAFGAVLLFAYAIGHGLPAILVGLLAGSLAAMEKLAPYGRALQIAGGWLIILVGFYLIAIG